jgi:uncharacterized protein (DUF2062 family)
MLRRRLQRWLPSPDSLRANRTLRWLGPVLAHPGLWQLSRRRVATGAAIGVFFGFLVPVLQIAFAAAAAVVVRANLPVAAVSTLVTNPFTFAPVYVAAYYTGAAVLGEDVDASAVEALSEGGSGPSWTDRFADVGKPWIVGLVVFAVAGGAATWIGVHVAWIAGVRLRRWRTRRRRRRPEAD